MITEYSPFNIVKTWDSERRDDTPDKKKVEVYLTIGTGERKSPVIPDVIIHIDESPTDPF